MPAQAVLGIVPFTIFLLSVLVVGVVVIMRRVERAARH